MRPGAVAVGALCLVQFVDVLGVTVVVTALPVMLADLGAPPSSGSLVVTAYAMFFGGLLMLGARLGDRFGHRRAITAGLVVFAAASLLGALAGSVVVLAAARCLQGAAAAASVPSALRLLTTLTAEGPARRRAIAAWSAAGGCGRRERLRHRRDRGRPDQLARHLLGLPAAGARAGSSHPR